MPAKVHNVKKSMSEYKCNSCGETIPIGSPYRYFKPGYFSRIKVKRCMKSECSPKRSELEQSKLAELYSAQEDAEVSVRDATDISEFDDIFSDLASTAEQILQDYEEAVQAGPMLEGQIGDRMSALDSFAQELRSFDAGEGDLDSAKEAALEAIDSFGF